MRKLKFVAGSIFFAACCLFVSVVNAVEPSVNVVDEEGKPVTKFEVMFNTANMGRTAWEQRDGGSTKIPTEYKDAVFIDVLIRADGFASTIVRYEDPKNGVLKESKGTITLKTGKPVKLQFKLWEGAKWPEGSLPEVYFAMIKDVAEIMRQPSNRKHYATGARELDFGMTIKPDGENAFKLQLADDTPPFYVAVHHDGFVRFFSAGPFTMADVKDGVLTVEVPKPAQLELKFDTSTAKEDELPKGVTFNVLAKLAGGADRYLEVEEKKFETVKDAALSLVDLPAGEYRYTAVADPELASQPVRRDELHPSPFHDVGLVKLASGESKTVDVKFVPLDMNVTRGDRTAIVHIVKPNQQPAAGKKVTIAYIDQHYGAIPVFNGEVPESGAITLENITQGKKTPMVGFNGYIVRAGWESLGQFNFTDDQKRGEFSFRLPIGVGDEVPDLDLIDVNTGKHTRLSEFRGKGVWLELWATWCGPCQPAMAELVKAYGEHREEWEGKVAVVPVSVDDTSDVVVLHTKDRGWDVFPQYWTERAKDRTNFGSSAASQLGVSGVPTAYIIGPDGKIRWTGHPASATRNGGSLAEFIKAKLTD